jgi:hypothetical protein
VKQNGEWRYMRSAYEDREGHILDIDLALSKSSRACCGEVPPG